MSVSILNTRWHWLHGATRPLIYKMNLPSATLQQCVENPTEEVLLRLVVGAHLLQNANCFQEDHSCKLITESVQLVKAVSMEHVGWKLDISKVCPQRQLQHVVSMDKCQHLIIGSKCCLLLDKNSDWTDVVYILSGMGKACLFMKHLTHTHHTHTHYWQGTEVILIERGTLCFSATVKQRYALDSTFQKDWQADLLNSMQEK